MAARRQLFTIHTGDLTPLTNLTQKLIHAAISVVQRVEGSGRIPLCAAESLMYFSSPVPNPPSRVLNIGEMKLIPWRLNVAPEDTESGASCL